ncbi:MAG: methyltransferase domain-containing protein [Acidobacteria bacterium]|nr:methyltransferase domain-containing protein [Acidobacteriota bacterium]
MGLIGGTLGYSLLRKIGKVGETGDVDGSVYVDKSKLETLLGNDFWRDIEDKVVIDFGCGSGSESVEMAQRGARKVVGIDIQERFLSAARERARQSGVGDRCTFATKTDEHADVIVAIDSFEHFNDPAAMLRMMREMLKPDGYVIASFGPPWYHPLGGHSFSVFPWAHLIFTEEALIRWRSDFKSDGATRFQEVEGGLNQMTIRRFERIVRESPFKFARFEAVPIAKLQMLANRLTREFTTAALRCKLIPRD